MNDMTRLPGVLPNLDRLFGTGLGDVMARAVDCHFHVFGPHDRYPLAPERAYTPDEATLVQHRAAAAPLGMTRGVLVGTSVYGLDNAVTLDALARRAAPTRAVINAGTDTRLGDPDALHAAGVRGVRVNALREKRIPWASLETLAGQIAPLGWHIEVLTDVAHDDGFLPVLRDLPVDVVFAHMGFIRHAGARQSPGFGALQKALADNRAWVKLSSMYRLQSAGADYSGSLPVMRALIEANPARLVWGSDWPHPFFDGPTPAYHRLVDMVGEAAGTPETAAAILAGNAETLYQF